MPEAVDVGSVLGGRYKVTAYVLASAEKDLVLDGMDQVLNRPVSILVASAGNASQVATSARELATGDRMGSIQVLDLGITEAGTYLVTNRAPAADMLDLIVQQDAPVEHKPYVEPFFTDTLGSEIFGRPRSTEPETYDYEDQYEDDEDTRHQRKFRLSGLPWRRGRQEPEDEQQDETSDLPPVAADPVPEHRPTAHLVPPPPSRRPVGASPAAYREDPEEQTGESRPVRAPVTAGVAGGAAAAVAVQPERAASRFPLFDRDEDREAHDGSDGVDGGSDGVDDDNDGGGRTFTRVLVGVVLSIVLVIAVVLAATTLGSLVGGQDPVADGTQQTPGAAASEDPTTAPATPTAEPVVEAVPPVITGITRLVPDNPGLDAGNDRTLPLIIDGNPTTYWGNQVYASDTFGGLATSMALVVELEEESTVSQVSIDQLNGAGGTFTVSLNDAPTLDGARQITRSGFTSPTVNLPVPAGAEGPEKARFVIINFTQLPRLSNIQAQFPFGVRIAEVRVT